MTTRDTSPAQLRDGAPCTVIGGTRAGRAGTAREIHTSETGEVTITVVQANGERLETLAKNVAVKRVGEG